jgi:uncharacterized membrane protein
MGPVEYLVVEFPGNQFKGDVVPALEELTHNGTIHIIDLVFIRKEADGSVQWIELANLPADEAASWNSLDGEVDDLLSEEDVLIEAEKLQPNSSAAFVVFEHTWATRLRDAVVDAGGRLVDNDRIPASVVEAAYAAAQRETN